MSRCGLAKQNAINPVAPATSRTEHGKSFRLVLQTSGMVAVGQSEVRMYTRAAHNASALTVRIRILFSRLSERCVLRRKPIFFPATFGRPAKKSRYHTSTAGRECLFARFVSATMLLSLLTMTPPSTLLITLLCYLSLFLSSSRFQTLVLALFVPR